MKKKTIALTLLLMLFSVYGLMWFSAYKAVLPGYHAFYYTPEKYLILKARLKDRKEQLYNNYLRAKSKEEKSAALKNAQRTFRNILMTKVFPFWYGTRWNFYGNTSIPGESSIACGYFVTTVLQDVGCPIRRARLAQAPSEEMIKSLVKPESIRRYTHASIEEFVQSLKEGGNAVYVVGLDNHTGFAVCEENKVYFIHSSGRFPFCVVKEEALSSVILKKSNYRVTGCLTKDEDFMKKWMNK